MPEQADAPTPVDPPLDLSPNGVTDNGTAVTLGVTELQTQVEAAPTQKLGIMGYLAIGWLATLIGAAILAPILPLKDPGGRTGQARQGPIGLADIVDGSADWAHPLGVNGTGRDMLSQVVFGARTSLTIAVAAVAIGMLVGGFFGLLAGYRRGAVDTVITMAFNVLLSIPALVMALSLIAIFANSDENTSPERRMTVIIVALGIVSIPLLGRITRASTVTWSEREFVKAAQVAGARPLRIMFREVLPNVLPAMFSIGLLGIAVAIVAEGSLSILGIGVEEVPSWGRMIAIGRDDLSRAPHIVMVPSIAIFFTVLSLNYLGDVVRARFDVRESVL